MCIVLDPSKLANLKKPELCQQLDIHCELLKEAVIAKTKLPKMLKAILKSDERFGFHTGVLCSADP
jgi:hypothetical protein